jgi:RHS repeat-associated protein
LTFAYDHLGRRIAKKVSPLPLGEGQGEGAQHDYRYLYEGWNVVAQFTADTSNAITPDATYLWSLDLSGTFHGAGGVGGLHSVNLFPLPMGEGQGEGAKLCLACYDANGNIIAWTETTGRVLQRQDYDPFGNRVIRERLAITPEQSDRLEYGFSTKPLDAETGFIYYIHRYYGPRHGHWLSRDPMQEAGGLNLYGFVGNGGVGNIDKLGLLAFATMPEKILGKYDQGSEIYFGSNGATETAVEPNFLAQEVYEIHLRIPVQFCFCDENNPTLAKFASTATDQKVAAKAYAERIKRLVESKFTADVKWAYLHKDSNEIRRVGLSVRTTLEFRGEPGEACEPWSLETGNSNSHNTVYVDDDWPDTVYGNTLSRIHLRKEIDDRTVMHEFGHVIGFGHPHEDDKSYLASGWAQEELMTQTAAGNSFRPGLRVSYRYWRALLQFVASNNRSDLLLEEAISK